LRAETRWEDGTYDAINVETLQSPEWAATHGAQVGAEVPLPWTCGDGLPEQLRAQVLANEPCPTIPPGLGRVVLTTVNHLNRDVRALTVEDDRGWQEVLRPTGLHRFFREQDSAWVAADQLRQGDWIRGRFGPLTIVVNQRVPGIHTVYNLTVEGEHVYHVSSLGVLVHNNYETDVLCLLRVRRSNPNGPRWSRT